MHTMIRPILGGLARVVTAAILALAPSANAQSLATLSNQEAATGLRDALIQGAGKAIGTLGRENGFLGNGQVKIPLPPSVQRVEGMLRTVGMGRYADQLITSMNRAAEAAVPEARALLTDSIKKMSLQDAKSILSGPQDAATQYFKRTTSGALTERFLPIVKRATEKVQLARTYDEFAGKAASFGLVKAEDANLDQYVTQKALDGLFVMIAEEEKSIRQNPVGAATSVAKKVFEMIGR
jgi:Protein of unknown function (DUF4197)